MAEDLALPPQLNSVGKRSASDSQGMNTVVSTNPQSRGLVKTVDAQKEVFVCEGGAFIKDVTIFTEIFEDLGRLPENPVVFKDFFTLTCLKDATTLTVESCVFSPTTRIFSILP